MLSTDAEIDEQHYALLQPAISHTYEMAYDPESGATTYRCDQNLTPRRHRLRWKELLRELLSPALWRRSLQALEPTQGRTGLTPNILAQWAFACRSMTRPPDPKHYLPESDREIDRHTLTGAWDNLFVALIKERCRQDAVDEEALLIQFKAHMNRGYCC
ncbi:MAG: DndE family protein [Caldilineaceae bacterium]